MEKKALERGGDSSVLSTVIVLDFVFGKRKESEEKLYEETKYLRRIIAAGETPNLLVVLLETRGGTLKFGR